MGTDFKKPITVLGFNVKNWNDIKTTVYKEMEEDGELQWTPDINSFDLKYIPSTHFCGYDLHQEARRNTLKHLITIEKQFEQIDLSEEGSYKLHHNDMAKKYICVLKAEEINKMYLLQEEKRNLIQAIKMKFDNKITEGILDSINVEANTNIILLENHIRGIKKTPEEIQELKKNLLQKRLRKKKLITDDVKLEEIVSRGLKVDKLMEDIRREVKEKIQ